jgi:hypothetical protein
MRRGQSSFEFVMLASAMLVGVTLTVVVATGMLAQLREDQQQTTLSAIELAVIRELDHAYTAPTGYSRTFVLPSSIDGAPYTTFVLEEIPPRSDALIFTWENTTRLKFLPYNINGTLGPGQNTVNKTANGLSVGNS